MQLQGRLGALAERNFRLVFSSTTISAVGDGVTTIALAFAVLQITDSPSALGIVLAARQASAAAITVAAGVWADRLPRHLVLVAAATVQGAVQAVDRRADPLRPRDRLVARRARARVFGLADGFVIPTSQGLIPAIVSSTRLQQANALLGLSRSIVGVLGPALGGVLVAVGSPGGALLVDAASFGLAALLLLRVSIPRSADPVEPEPFLDELRARLERVSPPDVDLDDDRLLRDRQLRVDVALRARPAGREAALLGREHLGAAGQLASAPARSAVASSRSASGRRGRCSPRASPPSRSRSSRSRSRSSRRSRCSSRVAVLAGIGLAIHLALWFTTFQRNVPEAALSRVSSYDALGSFVLMPLGSARRRPGRVGGRDHADPARDDRDRARLLRDHHRAAERLGDPRRAAADSGAGMIRDRSMLALLAGEFVSRLGSQFTSLALPWFVLVTTHPPGR